MADRNLRSFTFPGLADRYVIPKPDVNADNWYDPGLWAEGHLVSNSGALYGAQTYNRMCTPELIPANVTHIKVQDGYKIIPYCWSADGSTYLGLWNGSEPVKAWNEGAWLTGTVDLKAISTEYRFKFIAQLISNSRQLVPETDADKIVFVSYTDESLAIGGKAADAKETGSRLALLEAEIPKLNEKASIIIADASGSVASFGDGANGIPMKSLIATIEPVQDLHGYSNPWPAGGGNNLFDINSVSKSAGTNCTVSGDQVTLEVDGSVTYQGITFGSASNLLFPAGTYYIKANVISLDVTTYTRIGFRNSNSIFINRTPLTLGQTAFNVTISEPAFFSILLSGEGSNKYANSAVIKDIMVSTVDTGFEPYSNICPISGWTGLTARKTNVNLAWFSNRTTTHNGITFTFANGVVTVNGTASGGNAFAGTTDMYLNAGTYSIFNLAEQPNGVYILVQNSESNITWPVLASTLSGSLTFTLTRRTKVSVRARVGSGVAVTDAVLKPVLVVGTDAPTEFVPCVGNNIQINWEDIAGTVYGGTVDLISGNMVADRVTHSLTGNEQFIELSPGNSLHRFGIFINKASSTSLGWEQCVDLTSADTTNNAARLIMSHFKYQSSASAFGTAYIAIDKSLVFWDQDSKFASLEAFKSWLAEQYNNGQPVQISYLIDSPLEYQLAPHEVTTLYKNNVVWTNVGPVSVSAPRDTKLYIDGKIAEAVAAALNA